MAATKWGIAGCGKISSDFATALLHEGTSKHVIVAVAARSLEAAEQFGDKFGAQRSYDYYGKLGQDEGVDIVYVGTINTTHFEIVKSLLMARKPVLCEKPMCLTAAQTEELVALARKQKTFLMEGIWSRHFPVYKEFKARLQNKELGDLKHAFVSFGVPLSQVPNVSERQYGGGAMFAIGLYALQYCLVAFGEEDHQQVLATGTLNEEGLDSEVCVTMTFPGGRHATCVVSTTALLPNEAVLAGTKGMAKMDCFCSPTTFSSPSGDFSMPLDPSDRVYNFPNSQGLKYEAAEVRRCLQSGETESPSMPLSESVRIARLMQTVLKQVGVEW